ncbi:hypothetical protein SAMN04487785_11282 [Dyella jiangningensis]|uniref:hypothetical protein n=1 Tax=Dyella sp. AtDHG13 TaxID=1938897 RepID=UPI00088ADC19|nr:hypothetical protein [Dyella sp. AtDHG13]PXV54701.1 hypothetical protein BDW41_11282 [Dyella sp. AtDHG13]SDK88134.1 hypothetical protein SAMN04487785_11282 [Dyella jiangningensis]
MKRRTHAWWITCFAQLLCMATCTASVRTTTLQLSATVVDECSTSLPTHIDANIHERARPDVHCSAHTPHAIDIESEHGEPATQARQPDTAIATVTF